MGFCTNCGNELNGEKFCPKCGASTGTEGVQDVATNVPVGDKKGFLGKLIAIIIALGILISGFLLLTSRSYEALVKDYVKASLKGDAKKIVSLMPDSLVEYVAEEEFDGDKDEMIDSLEDYLDSMVEYLEDNDVNLRSVSYEITDVDDMDEDTIDDLCDEYRKAKLKIKEGKELEVELKIPIDGEEQTNSVYINVVKIGRSWYLLGV